MDLGIQKIRILQQKAPPSFRSAVLFVMNTGSRSGIPRGPGRVRFNDKDVEPLVLMEYNGLNQLVRSWASKSDVRYVYRPDGLRHSKAVDDKTTTHVWDGASIVAEHNASGMTMARYLRGAGLILREQDGVRQYYHHNAHGDVTLRTDGAGNTLKRYDYDAFGVEREPEKLDANPFRYCGEYYDRETKTVYLRARHYSPGTGRFTAEDSARDGSNWYAYCGGNPVAFSDPSGHSYNMTDYFYRIENGLSVSGPPVATPGGGTGGTPSSSGKGSGGGDRGSRPTESSNSSPGDIYHNPQPVGAPPVVFPDHITAEAVDRFLYAPSYPRGAQGLFDDLKELGRGLTNALGSFVSGLITGIGQSLSFGATDIGGTGGIGSLRAYYAGRIVANTGMSVLGVLATVGGAGGGLVTAPTGIGAVAGYAIASAGVAVVASSAGAIGGNVAAFASSGGGNSSKDDRPRIKEPRTLEEELFMEEVLSDPLNNTKPVSGLPELHDHLYSNGDWAKRTATREFFNSGNPYTLDLHLNYNKVTGHVADVKLIIKR